ncbi:MAG TPA: hypothetical protein VFU36_09500 [Jatrophihabitans sp.]|nr:hypothetical protein [Jatrophihabitans sp.]
MTAAAFHDPAARARAAGYRHAFVEPDQLPELDLAPDPWLDDPWVDDPWYDGDGAVAEPDPFAEPVSAPLRRPSLRAELGALPAGPITGLARRALPPLPVPDGLAGLVPDGLRRGSTIAVSGSVSLLLALLGAPSRQGAWTALVGMPAISAEAAAEAGIDLSRLAIINPPGGDWTPASWTTAVGALLDAVDVVVARPGALCRPGAFRRPGALRRGADTGRSGAGRSGAGVPDGDARRLTSRARTKDALLVLFGQPAEEWPAVQLRLAAEHGGWTGIGNGHGRLTRRRLVVSATGRGRSARPRTGELWL